MNLDRKEQEFFNNMKHDIIKLVTRIEKLEHQINEIMLMLEDKKSDKPIWNALQNVETRVNAIEDAAILEQEQANQEIAVVTTYTNDLGGKNKTYPIVSKARQRTRESNEEYIKVRNK